MIFILIKVLKTLRFAQLKIQNFICFEKKNLTFNKYTTIQIKREHLNFSEAIKHVS